MKGKLILVPTPIGNLKDITLRALEVLKNADAVLSEDTRNTGFLLKRYEISNKMISYHQHNEHKVTDVLVKEMLDGKTYAMVSDAGTPGISDAAFFLVRACALHQIPVETLPGPTAFVPALVCSGLPNDRFVFEGFLPVKKGRQTLLKQLAEEERTMILYESPYKLLRTLNDLKTTMGEERLICVSREISKIYEEHKRGTITELIEYFTTKNPKGEFVITVSGKNYKENITINE